MKVSIVVESLLVPLWACVQTWQVGLGDLAVSAQAAAQTIQQLAHGAALAQGQTAEDVTR